MFLWLRNAHTHTQPHVVVACSVLPIHTYAQNRRTSQARRGHKTHHHQHHQSHQRPNATCCCCLTQIFISRGKEGRSVFACSPCYRASCYQCGSSSTLHTLPNILYDHIVRATDKSRLRFTARRAKTYSASSTLHLSSSSGLRVGCCGDKNQ